MIPSGSSGMDLLARATLAELEPRPHAAVEVGVTLAAAVALMRERGRGCVLVEDERRLVGIFTERDLLSRVEHAHAGWGERPIEAVMTAAPMVAHPDDSLFEAVRRLTEGRRRHLPICDRDGHLLGLVSIRDILAFIAARFPEELMNLPPDPSHES